MCIFGECGSQARGAAITKLAIVFWGQKHSATALGTAELVTSDGDHTLY